MTSESDLDLGRLRKFIQDRAIEVLKTVASNDRASIQLLLEISGEFSLPEISENIDEILKRREE